MENEILKIGGELASKGVIELLIMACGLGILLLFGSLLVPLLKRFKDVIHNGSIDHCSKRIDALEDRVSFIENQQQHKQRR